jgi:hypothetical protein
MNKTKIQLMVLFIGALLPAATMAQDKISMSLHFDASSEPGEVLSSYPLGTINRNAAFAHHGTALKKFKLPNGNEGWLYKAGEKAGIPSNYILQFSSEGMVIDVLHKDHRYKIGHSALQYQFLKDMEAKLRTPGPGPGK